MGENGHFDFISDKHFVDCVKWVCNAYTTEPDAKDIESLQENRLDPFKALFDMMNERMDSKKWLKKESIRQSDKTVNNPIGEFHQKLLGGVKGWSDLGTGDDSHLDLKKNDDSIFMELKNKFNTVNGSSLESVRRKLEQAVSDHPASTSYWAFIIAKNGSSRETEWTYKGTNNPKIKKVWGSKVYELVTGKPNALQEVWNALPEVIKVVIGETKLDGEDLKFIQKLFCDAFFNVKKSRKV